MIEARGTVLRAAGGRAWISVGERPGGCGRCDEPGGCRSAKLAYALKGPKDVFALPDPIGVRAGDEVLIRIEGGAPLRGALASYGLGAVLLLAGAGAGHALASSSVTADLYALGGAAGGLIGAFWINRLLMLSRRWRAGLSVQMIKTIPPCAGQGEGAA